MQGNTRNSQAATNVSYTDQQQLLLSNVTYFSGSTGTMFNAQGQPIVDAQGNERKFETLGEMVDYYKDANGNYKDIPESLLSGGFTSESMQEIFKEIDNDSTLRNSQIAMSSRENYHSAFAAAGLKGDFKEPIRGVYFVPCGEDGKQVGEGSIVYRGTGGLNEAWEDNVRGLYMNPTPLQDEALNFAKDVERNIRGSEYETFQVSGHSKGGNLAMHVAIQMENSVSRCVGFDSQGFNEDYIAANEEKIRKADQKMFKYSAYNECVNELLTDVSGTTMYFDNTASSISDAHKPDDFYFTNKANLLQHNGMFHSSFAKEQNLDMKAIGAVSEYMDKTTTNENKEWIGNVAGTVVGVKCSGGDMRDMVNAYEISSDQATNEWKKDADIYDKLQVANNVGTVALMASQALFLPVSAALPLIISEAISNHETNKKLDFLQESQSAIQQGLQTVNQKVSQSNLGHSVQNAYVKFTNEVSQALGHAGIIERDTQKDTQKEIGKMQQILPDLLDSPYVTTINNVPKQSIENTIDKLAQTTSQKEAKNDMAQLLVTKDVEPMLQKYPTFSPAEAIRYGNGFEKTEMGKAFVDGAVMRFGKEVQENDLVMNDKIQASYTSLLNKGCNPVGLGDICSAYKANGEETAMFRNEINIIGDECKSQQLEKSKVITESYEQEL